MFRQVFLKGICLLVNNLSKLAKFKMTALVRITEFAYYTKKWSKALCVKSWGLRLVDRNILLAKAMAVKKHIGGKWLYKPGACGEDGKGSGT